ncbi:MAG: cyclic peptide export ABC transporter [Kordiimonadaceae bacterium]|nr:cyclic peptide export ABC transporter [Kordiimonadaceae bacterium]
MAVRQFIERAHRTDLKKMVLLTVIAGFANALLIVVINQVAILVAEAERPSWLETTAFLVAFILYYVCNKRALLRANSIIEGLLKDLRVEVVDKLRKSELRTVNDVGRGRLYSLLAYETNHLSVAFPLLVESFQQTVLLAAALTYLAYLSWAALLIFLFAILTGMLVYWSINQSYSDVMQKVTDQQARMLDLFGDILHGSKELRLNSKRRDDVSKTFAEASQNTEKLLTSAGEQWTMLVLLSAFVMYLMLGIVAFIFPHYVEDHSVIIFQLVPTLLFCLAPLSKIVAQSPMFLRANVGLQGIFSLEQELDAAGGTPPLLARKKGEKFQDFQQISFTGMLYNYRASDGDVSFTSGPWDLTLNRGELVFLVGGNGSGKSTALRLISGLYQRDAGQTAIDGNVVPNHDIAGARELFSALFGDFHLFDRFYGLENVSQADVDQYIDMMEMTDKVKSVDGSFSQLQLSTGQRKRLALIVALLEDRPVYLFDEWSAEQDVHFREIFYTRILADLKAKGKTVVVVTHDERFWHLADRVIKFDMGQIEWERPGVQTRQ